MGSIVSQHNRKIAPYFLQIYNQVSNDSVQAFISICFFFFFNSEDRPFHGGGGVEGEGMKHGIVETKDVN